MDQSDSDNNIDDQISTYIESLITKDQWKQLSIKDLDDNITNPCCALAENDLKRIFELLSFDSWEFFLKKLWTVQDVVEYEESTIYLEIIQALLVIRLESDGGFETGSKRKNALRQLAYVNLIMQTSLLDGIAETINVKREEQQLNNDFSLDGEY